MEGRLRKRSARLSDSSGISAEPVRKKPRKQESPVVDVPQPQEKTRQKVKKNKGNKKETKNSPLTKRKKSEKSNPESRKSLLVSLNIHDNDLQISTAEKIQPSSKTKGRGIIQRSESVEMGSDFGSTISSMGNGCVKRTQNFKNPNFTFSSIGSNKKRIWKNLKQLLTAEKSSPPGSLVSSYAGTEAPPSFNPAKKYSDLSGFTAKYTDPLTRIFFSSTEEFQMIRSLPQDVVQGYLTLRGKLMIT